MNNETLQLFFTALKNTDEFNNSMSTTSTRAKRVKKANPPKTSQVGKDNAKKQSHLKLYLIPSILVRSKYITSLFLPFMHPPKHSCRSPKNINLKLKWPKFSIYSPMAQPTSQDSKFPSKYTKHPLFKQD